MKKLTGSDSETKSMEIVADNICQLRALFPELVTEGDDGVAVNVDVLKQLVGDRTTTDAEEKYGLSWHGKRRARQLALTPSTGTLRPCPKDSVDWDATQNLMIEGDNLEVLKLLQKSYAGKVKLIYIDPPYNTGRDFVYPDNFQNNIANYLELTGQTVAGGKKITSNTETSGRFHSDWLNMLFPRLKCARALLTDDGVICISIDDGEVDHLLSTCREIFGEENFLAVLIWNKQHSQQQGIFKRYHEYVVVFAKNVAALGAIVGGEGEIDAGALKKVSRANPASEFTFPAGVRCEAATGTEFTGTFGDSEKVTVVSGRFRCIDGRTTDEMTLSAGWTQRNQMASWFAGQETLDTRGQKVIEFYFSSSGKLKCRKERGRLTPPSLLPEYGMVSEQTGYLSELMGAEVFTTPKPVAMISDFVSWFTSGDDIIVDFFAGSGTTAESVWRCNVNDSADRHVVLVQLPEPLDRAIDSQKALAAFCDKLERPRNIAELTKERLRRAAKKIKDENPLFAGDLGFRVFELARSNIQAWEPDRDSLVATLEASVEHLRTDRTEQDILYELLLKLGLDLCVPIEVRSISGHEVHSVGAGTLLVCLSSNIANAAVEPLALGLVAWHQALKPAGETTVVFRDSAFVDDVAKTNLTAILRQSGLETVRSL